MADNTADKGFPTAPADVTATWLSAQLGEPVGKFTIAKVGQGFTSDAHRITYGDADKTVVLKLPSALGEAKQKAHAKDCTIEVLFYKEFAAKVSGLMKLPKVFSTDTDPKAPHRWYILMEDLGTGSLEEFPSAFLFGKAHVPDVVELTNQLLSNLALVHGKFWKDEESFKHPIFSVQDPMIPGSKVGNGFLTASQHVWAPNFRGTGKTASQVVAELLEKHAGAETDVLKCKDVFSGTGKFIGLVKAMHTQDVKDAVADIVAHFDSRPHTLLHGDAHLGNIFLDRPKSEITWIDFQFLGRGPAGLELVQATTNLEIADRIPAFKHYYAELIKAGPAGLAEEYSYEDLLQDWRYLLFCFSMALTVAYFPDVVPYVAGDATANPDSPALKGWQLRCERWADAFELADIYSVPAELAAKRAAKK